MNVYLCICMFVYNCICLLKSANLHARKWPRLKVIFQARSSFDFLSSDLFRERPFPGSREQAAGQVQRRAVSPARHPPSAAVLANSIKNFPGLSELSR